jgi:hypothetical protein
MNLWVTKSLLDSFCAHNPITAWHAKGSAIFLSRRDLFPSSIAGPKSALMDHRGFRKQHDEAYSSRSKLPRVSRFDRHSKRCIRLPVHQSELANRFIALENSMQPPGMQLRQGLSFRGKWKDGYRMIILRKCLQRIENLQFQAKLRSNELEELKKRWVDRDSIIPI